MFTRSFAQKMPGERNFNEHFELRVVKALGTANIVCENWGSHDSSATCFVCRSSRTFYAIMISTKTYYHIISGTLKLKQIGDCPILLLYSVAFTSVKKNEQGQPSSG